MSNDLSTDTIRVSELEKVTEEQTELVTKWVTRLAADDDEMEFVLQELGVIASHVPLYKRDRSPRT